MTLKEVGRNLGGRDHSTIIHSIKQVNDITYPGISEEIKEILGNGFLSGIRTIF